MKIRWLVVLSVVVFAGALVLEGLGEHGWAVIVAAGALLVAVISHHQ